MILAPIIWTALPGFFRTLGMSACFPLPIDLGGVLSRVSISLAFSLLFLADQGQVGTNLLFASLAEFSVGVILGLPVLLMVQGASMAGELFDALRGQTIAAMYESILETPASLMSGLYSRCCWLSMLRIGVFEECLRTLGQSFAQIKAGGATDFLLGSSQAHLNLIVFSIRSSFSLVLPFALLFVLSDLCIAMVEKALPGMELYCEALQLRSLLGFVVLLLTCDGPFDLAFLGYFQKLGY